jgi:hypothetical protein
MGSDMTEDQHYNVWEPELPSFDEAKQQRSELIAELRHGGAGEQRLADLLAQCRKGNRCNLDECAVCERRKRLPKWEVPASVVKTITGRSVPRINLDRVEIIGERRPLNEKKLRAIAASMDRIGLQTPITVRCQKKRVILVSGWYRLAAAKRLGWDAIPSVELYGENVDARTWQLHENLCRADLTVLERAEHIEEQRKLVQQKSEGGQVAPPGGHQPKDVGVKKTAKALGLTREEVRRSKVIAALSAKTKAEVRKLGLDDNQAALLEIAKQPATSAQLRAVKEIAARKRADLVRYVSATSGVMDKKTTDEINALEADIRLKVGIVERINDALAARRKRLHEIHDKLAVEDALAASSECANDVSLPTTPTQDAVESGALPSTTRDDNRNMQDGRAADPKYAPAPEAVATAAETKGQFTPPPGDDDIPAFLDRRPLSAEDQRVYDVIMAALNSASVVVRARVRAELVRSNA